MKFVEIKNGKLIDAPAIIVTKNSINISPTDADYKADPRYYEKIDVKPEKKTGYYIEEDGFDVDIENKKVIIKYKHVENPKEYRKISKYKLMNILVRNEEWNQFKQWLDEIGYYDLFVLVQELDESDPLFPIAMQKYKEKFGKSNEEIEIIIEEARI